MNKSVIKCNLEVYSAFVLKFGSTTMRPYKYEIQVEKGLNINIKLDAINKNIVLLIGNKALTISTTQYDHLLLSVTNVGINKRQLALNLV